jgi:hypothetical protein
LNQTVLITAAGACLVLSSCAVPAPESKTAAPVTSAPVAAPSAGPATASSSVRTGNRDWVAELVALGYQPGKDKGQWLDDMMTKDAPTFCVTSLTDSGGDVSAGIYKRTEFEYRVVSRARVADPAMELGFVMKTVERFCPKRLDALDMVLSMHPELPQPKGGAAESASGPVVRK